MATTAPTSDLRPTTAGAGRSRLSDDRGQTLVEFAMASVVFFGLILGTIQMGIVVFRYNMVADLAQEGARWAAVHGGTSLSPSNGDGVDAFVQGRAQGFPVTVTTTPEPLTLSPGQSVTVLVQTTYTPVGPLLPSATLTLRSTASMTVSR